VQRSSSVLTSLLNFRDLSGMRTRAGASIAPGRVYRSDGLTHLSQAERDELRNDLGVRTIIDLRSGLEHERLGRYDPSVFGDTCVLELPVLNGAAVHAQAARGELDMDTMYRAIAFDGAAHVRAALTALTEPERLPAIITCTGGKDRTGVTVAILLAALDVPCDTILDDYDRSAAATEGLRLRVIGRLEGNGVTVPEHAFTVDRGAVTAVLDDIGRTTADVDTYLGRLPDGTALGETLRRTLLVKPAA
jgi:protein-tyrosine phosphatase